MFDDTTDAPKEDAGDATDEKADATTETPAEDAAPAAE